MTDQFQLLLKRPVLLPRFAARVQRLTAVASHSARIRLDKFAIVAIVAVLMVNLAFRFAWLDRLPGINGDEAWYGVQVQRFLNGKPWSARTPSGLPINPMLFLTEATLLSFLEPSFWILRLPIAFWACVGLGLTYVLHRWVFGDRAEAWLVTMLTACLPIHLAYSRFCWDSSFGLVSLPMIMYSLLKLLERESVLKAALLFVLGAIISLWVHVTSAVFVASALCVLAWEFRHEIGRLVRIKPITSICLTIALAVGLPLVARKAKQPVRLLRDSAKASVTRLPEHLVAIVDLVLGPRVYGYLAGVPRPNWTRWAYPLLLPAGSATVWILWRRGTRRDRLLLLLAGVTGVALLVVAQALSLRHTSYERYFLYLVPLAALICLRAGRTWAGTLAPGWSHLSIYVTTAISLGFLLQFWFNYFVPLEEQTHAATLHRTFRTGPVEPKAAAAAAIRERLAEQSRALVLAEDWWLQHAVEYLLGGRATVLRGVEPGAFQAGVFVIGHAGNDYINRARTNGADTVVEELRFGGLVDSPILALLVLEDAR